MSLAPSEVFRVALPEEVSAAVRAAFPDLRKLSESRAPAAWGLAAERLSGLAALWFDDAPWLSFDGELRQLSRGRAGELRAYALPSRASVLAAIGEREASEYRLVPGYRLGEGRQLWFAFGYGEDTPPGEPSFFAIPVLFSQVGGRAWTPLRHELGGTRRLKGTSFGEGVLLTDEGRKVLLLGEIDAGAEVHLDEFIMVPVSTECDLARLVFRDAPAGRRAPVSFDPRLLAAHGDRFLVDRASTNKTDLAFRVEEDGRLSGAIRDGKSGERFALNAPAPPGWDSRFRLCHGTFQDDRAMAVDLLDPGYVTVSVWSGARGRPSAG